MPTLDVFSNSAFSLTSLTDAINNIKAVPGRIAELRVFEETPVATTSVMLEERDGILELANPLPRGGPGQSLPKNPRTARSLIVPHFQFDDAIMADEVQNVRAFGTESELETVAGKVIERQTIHRDSLLNTKEFNRVGALTGIITYADGSTKNLFTEFGVAPADTVFLDLEAANPVMGALDAALSDVAVTMGLALGGQTMTGIWALCGRLFFRKLRSHPEVRELYKATPNAARMGDGIFMPSQVTLSRVFEFGGIFFEAYRGVKKDGTPYIPDNLAYAFPTGVPRFLRTYMAPADYKETVNTLGRELYTKQWEWQNGKGVALESQMNSLDICTRPAALVTLSAEEDPGP